MELTYAVINIAQAMEKMRLQSGKPVFDEWMILSMVKGNISIVYYVGPLSNPMRAIENDMRMLKEEMASGEYTPGHFYFSPEAAGRLYDAFMVAGSHKFILFNNTKLSMTEIAADPRWTESQLPFVELSEKFQMDPLM